MISRLTLPASLAHIEDMRRQTRGPRTAGRDEDRVSRRVRHVQRVGASYLLPSGRWIHGTR
jgi:hypothetical protein